MGRHRKSVYNSAGIDRRNTGYYSTPAPVADFFKRKLLSLNPHPQQVFDPCVGNGELLAPFCDSGARLCGFDIIDFQADRFFEFEQRDFLLSAVKALDGSSPPGSMPGADIIVANPPYNCHEHEYLRKHKQRFALCFGRSAALNLYSLFVHAIIRTAKPGCLIGLITFDSFLTARGHEAAAPVHTGGVPDPFAVVVSHGFIQEAARRCANVHPDFTERFPGDEQD